MWRLLSIWVFLCFLGACIFNSNLNSPRTSDSISCEVDVVTSAVDSNQHQFTALLHHSMVARDVGGGVGVVWGCGGGVGGVGWGGGVGVEGWGGGVEGLGGWGGEGV